MLQVFALQFVAVVAAAGFPPMQNGYQEPQAPAAAEYIGTWEFSGTQVRLTLLLRPNGTGHLADEVDTFPFEYSLDVDVDPARLELVYEVDMAFGRVSHSLVRLERTSEGDLLHWVSRHSDPGPPEWPESRGRTPPGVTWITFRRVQRKTLPPAPDDLVLKCDFAAVKAE
jgi:hypothetical protein